MNNLLKKTFLLTIVFVLIINIASAACPIKVQSKNTKDFLNEIPSLNSDLSNCPTKLHGSVSILIGSGITKAVINMKDGSTKNVFMNIQSGNIKSISSSGSSSVYTVTTDEASVDALLNANNKLGVFSTLYSQGKIKISATGFFRSTKLFFARPFLGIFTFFNKAPANNNNNQNQQQNTAGPTGKPDNCDDTYMQGHQGYAQNKALWDGYSANTDAVCQSQYGRGVPSPCVHTVQLSVQGNPYYLCWYNK
jgi:hypothetical protein